MWRHNTKKKNVAHFMRSCSICAASKSLNHLRMGTESLSAIALQPFKSWAMDLIGSLQKNVLVSKVHCWSALGPGASGPPYYCTSPATVPAVLEGVAEWLHNKQKKERWPSQQLSLKSNLPKTRSMCCSSLRWGKMATHGSCLG